MAHSMIPPEGPECEWKELLPIPKKVARTLAAFANGEGGSLWVGVSDDGQIVGVDDEPSTVAAIHRAATLCTPLPSLRFACHVFEGKTLVEARVGKDRRGPVSTQMEGGISIVYIRDGDCTRPAEAAHLRRLERQALPGEPPSDARSERVLAALSQRDSITLTELAQKTHMSKQSARRILVAMMSAGVAQEAPGSRFSLSPAGYRRAKSASRRRRRSR